MWTKKKRDDDGNIQYLCDHTNYTVYMQVHMYNNKSALYIYIIYIQK